jgi:site-specific DNA-methyltransferase (adenine-specific)
MIFAVGLTQLTSKLTRRTLYQTIDATGVGVVDPEAKKLLVQFDHADGNVFYERGQHVYRTGRTNCEKCGGQQKVIEAERENFAYPFLHIDAFARGNELKFDIIVGNPPYQIGMKDEKGERTRNITPLYDRFIDKAIGLNPRYVLMITPSRWFTGGKNLDDFRQRMLADRRIRKIVDYPVGKEVFPTVEVKGGISYFLWDREYSGDCDYHQIINSQEVGREWRDLREGQGVLIRDSMASKIVKKVTSSPKFHGSLADFVSTRDPFGGAITTNFAGSKSAPFEGSIPLIYNNKIGYIEPGQLQRNTDWVGKYKVLLPAASDGRSGNERLSVLGEPIALAPGSACTQSYLVAGLFEDAISAKNYASYLTSKFVRFLVLQRKVSQHLKPDRFRFVPAMDSYEEWQDDSLYKQFGLTKDEVFYIEKTIGSRKLIDSLDSPIPSTHLPGGEKFGKNSEPEDEIEDD